MLSLQGEVKYIGSVEKKGNYTYRNIEVYYGHSENPYFTLNPPMCYECDLQVGDQVDIEFEMKSRKVYDKVYNNLYITKYRKLNNTIYDCATKTVNPCSPKITGISSPLITINNRLNSEWNQSSENRSINGQLTAINGGEETAINGCEKEGFNGGEDETERALDMIFGSESDTVREQQRQREAMIAKVNPILQKLQADTEKNKQVPGGTLSQTIHKEQIGDNNAVGINDNNAANTEPDNAFVEMNDNTRSVCSKKESNGKEIAPLVQAYNNKSLIGFF